MFFFSFLNLWQYVQSLRTYGNVDFVVSNKTFVDTTHYCSLLFLSHFFCILFSTRKFDLVFFTNGNIILQSRITIFQILWKSRCHILWLLFHRHRPNLGLIGRFGFPWVPIRLNQKVWGSSPN